MEISRLVSAAGRAQLPPAAPAGTAPIAGQRPAPQSDNGAPPPPMPSPSSSTLGFQVDHRPGGLNVTRLVDFHTGDVVLQLPPEGVLQQVGELIEILRRGAV